MILAAKDLLPIAFLKLTPAGASDALPSAITWIDLPSLIKELHNRCNLASETSSADETNEICIYKSS
jgi:hypothetical protein